MSSIRELLAAARLPGDTGRIDAELLLGHSLGKTRSYLYTWPEQDVGAAEEAHFSALLAARRAGEPIAYLTGRREFWSLDLQVDRNVLIPRPETEVLVAWALALELPVDAAISDWGTGSGAIALALASERPGWTILATDESSAALAVAETNGARLGLANVHFVLADWGSGMAADSLDLVVSNPPYVAADDPHLGEGDLRFEPQSALVSGPEGLESLRRIAKDAARVLRPGGWLLLEHGHDQAGVVADLLAAEGFTAIECRRDLAGIERVSGGCRP
jgi:release factor glutamine methyltransferase